MTVMTPLLFFELFGGDKKNNCMLWNNYSCLAKFTWQDAESLLFSQASIWACIRSSIPNNRELTEDKKQFIFIVKRLTPLRIAQLVLHRNFSLRYRRALIRTVQASSWSWLIWDRWNVFTEDYVTTDTSHVEHSSRFDEILARPRRAPRQALSVFQGFSILWNSYE